MSTIIRRNLSFSRTYTFYAPDGDDPTQPDLASPIDLTGSTVRFVVFIVDFLQTFSTGITVTPLAGQVDVVLSPEQTSTLFRTGRGEMYLQVTDSNGVTLAKAIQAVEVRY